MGEKPRVEIGGAEALVKLVLDRLEESLRRMVEMNFELLRGERLAREVASFYKGLVEQGVPEELARKLTEKYLERLLSTASPVADILAAAIGGGGERVKVVSLGDMKSLVEAYQSARTSREGGEEQG